MNKSTLFALVFVSSLSVFADSDKIKCVQNAIPDKGYSVEMDKQTAVVSEVTIAGSNVIATLNCTQQNPEVVPADQILTVFKCSEPVLRDAGYTFDLNIHALTSQLTGVLSSVSIVGSEPVANLECQPQDN